MEELCVEELCVEVCVLKIVVRVCARAPARACVCVKADESGVSK